MISVTTRIYKGHKWTVGLDTTNKRWLKDKLAVPWRWDLIQDKGLSCGLEGRVFWSGNDLSDLGIAQRSQLKTLMRGSPLVMRPPWGWRRKHCHQRQDALERRSDLSSFLFQMRLQYCISLDSVSRESFFKLQISQVNQQFCQMATTIGPSGLLKF